MPVMRMEFSASLFSPIGDGGGGRAPLGATTPLPQRSRQHQLSFQRSVYTATYVWTHKSARGLLPIVARAASRRHEEHGAT
ncbi:hypothetical protein Q8A67_018117 [Cirrhinus molitorella]|uniref:Uncharacterized protein n=1 Tax=Cirrhinus molitorella TaxID=172907 RepID=A0AA88PFB7_9TELE|nr:hypothetical protein Q8A67_018117 [Cirrhinus molitorella]